MIEGDLVKTVPIPSSKKGRVESPLVASKMMRFQETRRPAGAYRVRQ